VAKSKLFTPKTQRHDCFVSPFTGATGQKGFAPTDTGNAPYPLKLGGSGESISLRPQSGPVTSSDDTE
jgi:hypothetical protein